MPQDGRAELVQRVGVGLEAPGRERNHRAFHIRIVVRAGDRPARDVEIRRGRESSLRIRRVRVQDGPELAIAGLAVGLELKPEPRRRRVGDRLV